MSLKQQFDEAAERVKALSSAPSNDTLLQLYALFKQASVGDVQGKRPGMLDMKGRAKFDAWSRLKGKTNEQAITEYVALVNRLAGG